MTIAHRENPICDVLLLGRCDYQEVWDEQKRLAHQRFEGEIPDTLLLLEHPPTLTLGRAAHAEHLLASPETLQAEGVTVLESDRGGDITYHGVGQLVGYPLLNLQCPPHRPDLHLYLRNIEEVLIRTLAEFDVEAERFPGYTGVWVGRDTPRPRKIAAIGVKVSRWVTMHGFALNVHPDLSHFDWIVPCGIREYGVTSLSKELGQEITLEAVIPHVIRRFGEVFGLEPHLLG
jgi:lipoyl(octanoyl) transferase